MWAQKPLAKIIFPKDLFYLHFEVHQWEEVMGLTSLDIQIMASFMVTQDIMEKLWSDN